MDCNGQLTYTLGIRTLEIVCALGDLSQRLGLTYFPLPLGLRYKISYLIETLTSSNHRNRKNMQLMIQTIQKKVDLLFLYTHQLSSIYGFYMQLL